MKNKLEKTVDIQSKMLTDVLDTEEADVLRAVNEYTEALCLLDQYDHQTLCKPDGNRQYTVLHMKNVFRWLKKCDILFIQMFLE